MISSADRARPPGWLAEGVPVLPMFPLGSVLFPAMPLQLRVFEERYLVMLSELVRSAQARFGVVLIERGVEVGGGEQRFGVGTVAEVLQVGADQGVLSLAAQGGARFEVVEWLPDDPYPRAEVRWLDELVWDPGLEPLRAETERLVRRTLALASEFTPDVWPADVVLAEEAVPALWQLAAVAPLTALDQVALLRAGTAEDLLTRIGDLTGDAALAWESPWPEG
jgi:Lon protease-like protein